MHMRMRKRTRKDGAGGARQWMEARRRRTEVEAVRESPEASRGWARPGGWQRRALLGGNSQPGYREPKAGQQKDAERWCSSARTGRAGVSKARAAARMAQRGERSRGRPGGHEPAGRERCGQPQVPQKDGQMQSAAARHSRARAAEGGPDGDATTARAAQRDEAQQERPGRRAGARRTQRWRQAGQADQDAQDPREWRSREEKAWASGSGRGTARRARADRASAWGRGRPGAGRERRAGVMD